MEKPYVPDFSKRLDSAEPDQIAVVDPLKDPHPKRHGSLEVKQGPRYLHIPGEAPKQIS